MSRSIGVASPDWMRSSILTVQFVPSRHGTHLPHDSWRVELGQLHRDLEHACESSTTMIAPEPSIEPALAMESKS